MKYYFQFGNSSLICELSSDFRKNLDQNIDYFQHRINEMITVFGNCLQVYDTSKLRLLTELEPFITINELVTNQKAKNEAMAKVYIIDFIIQTI